MCLQLSLSLPITWRASISAEKTIVEYVSFQNFILPSYFPSNYICTHPQSIKKRWFCSEWLRYPHPMLELQGLLTGTDSWIQHRANANPERWQVVAQVTELLPLLWEIRIGFLVPVFSPGPVSHSTGEWSSTKRVPSPFFLPSAHFPFLTLK